MAGGIGDHTSMHARGFVLDDATHIHRALMAGHHPLVCPRCGTPLGVSLSIDGEDEVDLVTCESCFRSVVIRHPAVAARC